eukprot:gnl/MRDRNA2_/MRDRNA2_396718_c0_seq1.p1 gnl/MRDRNA2_/MRDRNA2_396718_c0~~gnl/MRDRNA2_/MRDRNA2_396718_c0_seq1.p1  ORF type:complete len:124 (+),score=20.57 gnl/MRDRNA2_/MRDRNA2_396718_c0_seq1:43-372(+)
MAPEVSKGTCYDERSDVFSFAMITYEVICRRVPFEDASPENVAQLFTNGVRPDTSVEHVPPDTPGALVDLMKRCWSQQPEGRPSSQECVEILTKELREHKAPSEVNGVS